MKPSSLLNYSGWDIVDSPSVSPRQTQDLFLFYLNQLLLFQGLYLYGYNNHDLLQLPVTMCQNKGGVLMTRDPTKCKLLLSPDAKGRTG